jgi:hypothetical protein
MGEMFVQKLMLVSFTTIVVLCGIGVVAVAWLLV